MSFYQLGKIKKKLEGTPYIRKKQKEQLSTVISSSGACISTYFEDPQTREEGNTGSTTQGTM